MMSRRSWIWSLGGAGALALLAAAWFVLAPPKLGGSTSYAVIVGSSMEPHLHRGEVALVVLGVVALGFGLLAAVAFLRPAHRLVAYDGYRQVGTFGYQAPVPAGAAYPSGAATTGQPIFLRLAKSLSIRFDYRFDARSPHAVEGSGRILAELADPSVGWRRTLSIQPWTAFKGDRFSARGTLRLDRIESLIGRIERETGFGSGSHTLTLRPQIRIHGEVAQARVSDRFAPSLALELDPLVLRLAPAAGGAGVNALTSSRPGALSRFARTEVSALGLHLDAARARLYAPVV